jgi:hypothetical protein
MIYYEFYSIDKAGHHEFFGILPESRKDPKPITRRSIMKWGKLVVCDPKREKKIYFLAREVPDLPPKGKDRMANFVDLRVAVGGT